MFPYTEWDGDIGSLAVPSDIWSHVKLEDDADDG